MTVSAAAAGDGALSEPQSAQLDLRRCLGHFASGVTVITVNSGGRVHGATVSAFSAVSLYPPLILVSVARSSQVCRFLTDAEFAVNILAAHQGPLGLHFAGIGPGLPVVDWDATTELKLCGCLGFIRCSPWAFYDGGDHLIYLGEIQEYEFHDGEPLVVFQGAFGTVAGLAEESESAWLGTLDGPLSPWQYLTESDRRHGPGRSVPRNRRI